MTVDEVLAAHKAKTAIRDDFEKRVFFRSLGVGDDGVGHVVTLRLGDPDMDSSIVELKAQGFKFYGPLKMWICRCPSVGPKSTRVDFNRYIEFGCDKRYHLTDVARFDIVRDIVSKLGDPESTGFVGQPGERITVEVEFTGGTMVHSTSDFGDLQLLTFKDDEGRKVCWLQRNYSVETIRMFMAQMKSKKLTIVGTVKKHTTRLGEKTTDMTRCEISAKGRLLHPFAVALREQNVK